MIPLLPSINVKWKPCAYNMFGLFETVASHVVQQCFGKSSLWYHIRSMGMSIIGYIRLASSLPLIPRDFDMHDVNVICDNDALGKR